jgi:hypothetical protein
MSRLLKFGQPMGGIIQEAFIVPDVWAGAAEFARRLRIGPFFVIEHFPLLDYHYRGKPSEIDVTLALGFSGSMCFELIQQNCETPSVYNEVYKKRGWGFHHWAVATDRFDDDVQFYKDQGAEMALYGVAAVGARAAYMDISDTLPGMVELIEMTSQTEDFFATLHAASVNWDGKDPVRTFG